MADIVITMLLCQYLADSDKFDNAVSKLAAELGKQVLLAQTRCLITKSNAANIHAMCEFLIYGNTAVRREVLAKLEEQVTWA